MGIVMPHLSSLTDFKRLILNKLLNDREMVNLLTNSENHTLPAKDLLNRQVYLYDYVDGTIKSDHSILCIDADDSWAETPAVSKFLIEIIIAVPKSLMDMPGNIRRDAIAQRIDRLLNGSTEFGFGRLERKPGGRIQLNEAMRARMLRYSVEDWNRHGETL